MLDADLFLTVLEKSGVQMRLNDYILILNIAKQYQ